MPRSLLRFGTLLAIGGCYTYQPLLSPEAPTPGSRVSVQLTSAGSTTLRSLIGPNVLHVEGDLMAADSIALALAVRQVEDVYGRPTNWNGEQVGIPRDMIAGMQQRRFSPGGTALLGGVMGAALYGIYRVLNTSGLLGGGSSNGGGSGQGQ